MNAYLANPEMMSQIPPLDGARFEGRTLFINGDRSQFVSRDHTDSIKKVFPNSELVWFKDSGHLVHLDQQKEFCEKVVTFLERWTQNKRMSSSELITILTRKQICISRDHTDAIKKVFLNSKLVFFGFRTFIPHWSTEIILQKSCPFSWAMNINKRMPNSEMITVLTASNYKLVK